MSGPFGPGGPFGAGGPFGGRGGAARPSGPPQLPPIPHISRRARIVIGIVVALVVLAILFNVFVGQYTDLLWYDSVHFSSVYTHRLVVEVVMFVVAMLAVGGFAAGNVYIAYRARPNRPRAAPPPPGPDDDGDTAAAAASRVESAAAWQSLARRALWLVLLVLFFVVGIPAGVAAAKRWQLWMLWSNSTPFGRTDPQFHRDISYFAFTYPLERFVLNELFAAVTIAIIAVAVTSYLFGALRIEAPRVHSTPAARAHLSVLLGLFLLLKAAAYYLDRYGLAFSPRGNVTGPSYTDVHATLPAKTILIFIAVICALLFFANVRLRNLQLPALAFGLMVISAVLIGGAYPALIQHFKVAPSAQDLEAKYIGRNIQQTRTAFSISSVTPQPYAGTAPAGTPARTVRTDLDQRAQLRLLDPNVVTRTFNQLQQQRAFYSFPNPLDVDRYNLPGATGNQPQDVVLGVRGISLAGLQSAQQNWINQHLVYTHGYGAVVALSNQIGANGQPDFVESELPPQGALPITQPRVYFGEGEPRFSIVGAPPGTTPRELDLPADNGAGQTNYTYNGSGGVGVGSFWRKLLYAWKLRDKNVLLSSGVNADSRILYVRDPRARVAKVAPWLTLDSDPYPVIVNGQIEWVVDGYTTSSGYPYSEQESLASDTSTTLTTGESTSAQGSGTINYIRNSVKAVVNAYTGNVTLYQWNPGGGATDPVLRTWEKAFPGVVRPYADVPAALLPHLRYPEDLFNIQRSLVARYHVLNPKAFYNGTNFWKVPNDPTLPPQFQITQPAYYLSISPDGTASPVFSLTSTFTQTAGRNLTAFMSVDSQPGANYGKFTLLQLPTDATFSGPGQVQNQDIESDPNVSRLLSLLRQGGSTVTLGNLLTVPVDGSLVYVEPIYVQASGGTSYPVLRRVVAVYNGTTGFSSTLAGALNQAFAVAATTPGGQGQQPPTGGNGQGTKQRVSGASARVQADLARALAAQQQAQADLRAGDFAAYGRDQAKLAAALAAARRDAG